MKNCGISDGFIMSHCVLADRRGRRALQKVIVGVNNARPLEILHIRSE